ncbi:MAG: DUF1016 N-terminal domain-containing protein [Oscillospiraceae bacterium]|nr:DUF1016 N-terminal domain-containing protein [Oscillospiraceae bacterium]
MEVEQNGEKRANYGKKIIIKLSEEKTKHFEKGFSVDTLENARKFYLVYCNRISETLFRKFTIEKSKTALVLNGNEIPFHLTWSHYLQLIRIKDENERSFYEIEASHSGWSIRTLQRQYTYVK